MFEIINRKPNIDITDTSGIVLEDIKGDVELKDVFFRYPARPEQLILDGLCLHVPCGTTMAIVGESGSGKSTVISLMERFYDPQAGEVLVDGVNIKSLQLQWLREKISLVSQEPLLFMTSIKDNITYGKADATLEEIKRAAELANAANFIEKLPDVLTRNTSNYYVSNPSFWQLISCLVLHTSYRRTKQWLANAVLSFLGGRSKGLPLQERSLKIPKSFFWMKLQVLWM